MSSADFTLTLRLLQKPGEVFSAVNNVRGWWSEEIEGSTSSLHDSFTYHFEDVHYCQLQIITMIPDRKVEWLVKYNYFNFTSDRSEWTGTKISFEISIEDRQTLLRFTHHGLKPENECYGICSNAWGRYIGQSLLNLVTSGVGYPNQYHHRVKN